MSKPKLYFLDESSDFNPVAPTVPDLENATDLSPYVQALTPPTPRYRARVLGPWYGQWYYEPRDELLWRLNTRLKGQDPGEPFNWKGLR